MNKDLLQKLHTDLDSTFSQSPQGAVKSIRASEIGYPCDRYHVMKALDYDKIKPFPSDTLRIFAMGNIVEEAWIKRAREKYRIYNEQTPLEWRKYNITGHLDGMIELEQGKDPIPFDIKSLAPYGWQRFSEDDPDAWREFARHPFYQKWIGQGQIYMLLTNTPDFLFILVNKSNLQEKFIVMPLDLELAETLIQRAERVNAYIAKEQRPDPIEYEENLCGKTCPFLDVCQPPRKYEGATFVSDEEIEEAARTYFELKEKAKDYDEAWSFLKARLGAYDNGGFIGDGNYEFQIKEIRYKAQPEKKILPKPERIEKRVLLIDRRKDGNIQDTKKDS